MDIQLVVSLISCLGSAIGTITGVVISNKLVCWRLDNLENKVAEMTQLSDRITKLEMDKAVFVEKIDTINEKLAEISEALK